MGSSDASVFELTVPSRMEELESVQQFAESASEALGLEKEFAYWIELTVSESAINAIQHGNELDPNEERFSPNFVRRKNNRNSR